MRPPVAVIGLGHPLMGDEGVGVAVIEGLRRTGLVGPDVDVLDAGTCSLGLLHMLEGRRRVILVDCAFMGLSPGQIRRFTFDQVLTEKQLDSTSSHQADLIRLCQMARALGQLPDVVIFGIEPRAVGPGMGLSRDLACKLDNYIGTILDELEIPAGRMQEENTWLGS